MKHRRGGRLTTERGFTLVELLIALAIVAALLGVAFGGLRVALASWRKGEERTEAHQRVRGLVSVLAHAVEGAHPYRGARGEGPESVLLFHGTGTAMEFVTRSAPYPYAIPIAFTAVVIDLEEGETPGLVIKQRPLPNRNPFTQAVARLTEPSVTELTFRYLDASGTWRDTWDIDAGDPDTQQSIPDAVEISLSAILNGRAEKLPPLTVAIRTTRP
jgi:general secretion pathway protein J